MGWWMRLGEWRGRLGECEGSVDGLVFLERCSEPGNYERWLSHNSEGWRDRIRV